MLGESIREGTVNSFIIMLTYRRNTIPTANNLLASWNKQLCAMLYCRNGLSQESKTRLICWWCSQNIGTPQSGT